jgi:Gluconate 2-dehydrogenase subunit 3
VLRSFRFFTPETAATFRAAAGCIVPSDAESPGADSDIAIAAADHALAGRPERDRKLLTTFLKVVEIWPIFRYGRRFSNLSRERQEAFLRRLESHGFSKFRQGFFGLKTFALMGYYAHEDSWRDIGYPGPRLDAPYYELRRTDRR